MHSYVAISTTQADIHAVGAAARVDIWLGTVLPALGQPLKGSLTTMGDNQAALGLLTEKQHTWIRKNMDLRVSRMHYHL